MTRICMVAYTIYPDSRIRREAEALVERGDSVDLICLRGRSNNTFEIYSGVGIVKLPMRRYRGSHAILYLMSYLHFFLTALIKITYLHLKNPYDIVQVHTMPDFMVFVAIIPKLMGVKVILDVHDLVPELYQSKFGLPETHPLIRLFIWIERISISFADRSISVHRQHLDALLHHGNPPGKFSILLNVPDMKMFAANGNPYSVGDSSFNLIYHGTVSERHGLEVAIRAVLVLKDRIKNLKLSIIGVGDDIPRLMALVSELGLQDYVLISNGWVPLEELSSTIKNADIGIVPILYDGFTKYMLPVKLLEYVGLGIPVVCSRTETIEAYFDDSMVQYFSPGRADEMAAGILLLFQNLNRRNELRLNADKFNREFNWENQKQIYYQLIDGLAKEKMTN